MNPNLHNKQKGFSLLEIMLYLALVAIVGIPLGVYAVKSFESAEANSEAQITQGYLNDLKTKYRRGPYTGLDNDQVIDAGVPDPASISGSNITNLWGYAITFAPGTLTGGSANGAIQETNVVPQSNCLNYVSGVADYVDELVVGSTTVKSVGGTLNNATATTACAVTTATVNVIMRKA